MFKDTRIWRDIDFQCTVINLPEDGPEELKHVGQGVNIKQRTLKQRQFRWCCIVLYYLMHADEIH
jgi:hypothetical protein